MIISVDFTDLNALLVHWFSLNIDSIFITGHFSILVFVCLILGVFNDKYLYLTFLASWPQGYKYTSKGKYCIVIMNRHYATNYFLNACVSQMLEWIHIQRLCHFQPFLCKTNYNFRWNILWFYYFILK